MNKDETQAAQSRLNQLRSTRLYANLSTLTADGSPLASYAPCLIQEEGIYVYLSQLSGHCKNLLQDKRVGVLLMADESDVRNPFARQRISYQCRAIILTDEAERYSPVLDALAEQHGNTVALLRQLPDFVLFCLQPEKGTYVEGFGKAFELSGEYMTQLQHIDEQAVRSRR